jgi:urease accessory protein
MSRLIERQHLADGCLDPVAHHPWIGTLLFYPASEEHLETVRERLGPLDNFAGAYPHRRPAVGAFSFT